MSPELKFAVLIDYDNIAIGVKKTLNRSFDYGIVSQWLKQRGEVLAQIAYGNWSTHSDFRVVSKALAMHGVQMEHLETALSGSKNGADIALSIDAVELVFTQKHIDAFCILSGDSDFLPLVHKLKKHNKRVYVVAGSSFASKHLRRNCHEFVSYEKLCGRSPRRYESYPVTVPTRGGTQTEPLENAVPAVSHALRDMERRGEIPYIKQLGACLRRIEPDFDVFAFGFGSFKDLIIKLVNSGYFRRKMIGENRFCIAKANFPSHLSAGTPGARRAAASRRRRPAGTGPAGRSDFRHGRSPAPNARAPSETAEAVQIIKEAVLRIKHTGRLADLGLLYTTVLEIEPQFRAHGSRDAEFRRFILDLARQGYFRIKASSGASVVELGHSAQSDPARVKSRLGNSARQVLSAILEQYDSLLETGLPSKQFEQIISMQPGFRAIELGVTSPRHLLELAVRDGLLNARRDASGVVLCLPPDAGEEMVKALESRPRDRPSHGKRSSNLRTAVSKEDLGAEPVMRAARPASSESLMHDEPSGEELVDNAVEIVCAAVRTNRRIFGNGLLRSGLRAALQEAEPGFDLKSYGMRTFRALLGHLLDRGYLDSREEADGSIRYLGTELLSTFGSRPAEGSKLGKSGLVG